MSDAQVLVVGGGPAGSSTAWHLAQLGVEVTLLDRARFPRDKACAEYLSPQASRILTAMGVMETIESAGAAHLTGMTIHAPNGRVIQGHFVAQHGFRGFRDEGIAIRRTVLDALLLNRARQAGVRVYEGVRVTDVVRNARGRVTGVRVQDSANAPLELTATITIGADGLRSVVGRRLGLIRTARVPRRIALVAHYRQVRDVGDTGEMHVERDGYLGIANVGNGLTNVALVVPHRLADRMAGDHEGFFRHWIAQRPHLARRFAEAQQVGSVRATGPFASSARRAWVPGAALVGDAVDFFDPFTGEGIYTALRDGELLAPFVAESLRAPFPASDVALAAYERARRAEFAGKWRVERLIGMAVASPLLINHAARALTRHPDMADLLVGVAGDFVPPARVLRFGYLARLLVFGI